VCFVAQSRFFEDQLATLASSSSSEAEEAPPAASSTP
jgi:hypothetical protein